MITHHCFSILVLKYTLNSSTFFIQAAKIVQRNTKGKYTPVFLTDHSPIHRYLFVFF